MNERTTDGRGTEATSQARAMIGSICHILLFNRLFTCAKAHWLKFHRVYFVFESSTMNGRATSGRGTEAMNQTRAI